MSPLDEEICNDGVHGTSPLNVYVSEKYLSNFLFNLADADNIQNITVLGMSGNCFIIQIEFRF